MELRRWRASNTISLSFFNFLFSLFFSSRDTETGEKIKKWYVSVNKRKCWHSWGKDISSLLYKCCIFVFTKYPINRFLFLDREKPCILFLFAVTKIEIYSCYASSAGLVILVEKICSFVHIEQSRLRDKTNKGSICISSFLFLNLMICGDWKVLVCL